MDELILTLTEEFPDVIYPIIPIITEGLQVVYNFISMLTFML